MASVPETKATYPDPVFAVGTLYNLLWKAAGSCAPEVMTMIQLAHEYAPEDPDGNGHRSMETQSHG